MHTHSLTHTLTELYYPGSSLSERDTEPQGVFQSPSWEERVLAAVPGMFVYSVF